ncbi:MAG TPA: hypothetical protein VEL07_13045 [Planctomycetota bacterium]|nr:hypothetical protein [Planctomycetota bacterium]
MIAQVMAEKFGERNAGFVMLGFAAVVLLIAVVVGWGAITRWRAASALADWNARSLSNEHAAAREAGAEAAALAPSSAAAILAAADLASSDGYARLEASAGRVRPGDRALVDAALALSQAIRGKDITNTVAGPDEELLRAILHAERGEDTAPIASTEPATGAIARAAASRLARAAWRRGELQPILRAFGTLVLTDPSHKDAQRVRLVLAALDPQYPPAQFQAHANRLAAEAGDLLRACQRLAPERAAAIAVAVPATQRTPEDLRRLLLTSDQPIEKVVEEARRSHDPATNEAIAWRALDAGRPDLAKALAAAAPEASRKDLEKAIAAARGDLAALAELAPERTDLQPVVSHPIAGDGVITFHLATRSGLVPTDAPIVVLDGSPADVRRWDSLVSVPTSGAGFTAAEVRLGGRVLWSGNVAPSGAAP